MLQAGFPKVSLRLRSTIESWYIDGDLIRIIFVPNDMISDSLLCVFDAVCKDNSTSIPRGKPEEFQTHKARFEQI